MSIKKQLIDTHFDKLGIKVLYNTLGHNEDLIASFVSEHRDALKQEYGFSSNHVKHELYNKFFNLEFRHKRTGFESVRKLEREFRKRINKFIKTPQFSDTIILDDHLLNDSKKKYRDSITSLLKTIENPLLYFSGGLDSELLARFLLDSGKSFKTVIVEWLDDQNRIINTYELEYAYKFCKNNSIVPIIKTYNVNTLWNSEDFLKLGIELGLVSPQLISHAYTVGQMDREFPNHTHLFGGEIRFQNYLLDNGEIAKLVFLNKLVPGYNGVTYDDSHYGSCSGGAQRLVYFSGGTWEYQVQNNWPNSNATYDTLDSGSWTDTPGSTYEFRLTSITGSGYCSTFSCSGSYPSTPTGWSTIGAATVIIFGYCINAGYGDPDINCSLGAGIEVRVSGQSSPVQASSINFSATNGCI